MAKTTDEVYEAVLDVKGDVLETKMDVLVLHQKVDNLDLRVNHEQEKFTALLATKIDRDSLPIELFKSIGFKLANHKFVRWGLGVVSAWLLGSVILMQYRSVVENFLHNIFHFL